jgi:hypothetical protein
MNTLKGIKGGTKNERYKFILLNTNNIEQKKTSKKCSFFRAKNARFKNVYLCVLQILTFSNARFCSSYILAVLFVFYINKAVFFSYF